MSESAGRITDVKGIYVGHMSDPVGVTGCTAILVEGRKSAGVHIPGIAAGTRSFDVFRSLGGQIDGVLLSGGSSYGLDATGGALRYLEAQGRGFKVGPTTVPTVPTCIIFDLGIGDHKARPDAAMAFEACQNADVGVVLEGSVGVGTGATVGKLYGMERAMKSGVGTASQETPWGIVGALAVVNAFGECVDYETGARIAGVRDAPEGYTILDFASEMEKRAETGPYGFESLNTTLAVVATDVDLTMHELHRLSFLAQGAFTKTMSPAHSLFDGDVIISLSSGAYHMQADLNVLGLYAERALGMAITRAVKKAESLGGVPSYQELQRHGREHGG